MKNPTNITYRDCKFAVSRHLVLVFALAVAGCYHAPGSAPPAPEATGVAAQAAKTFPNLKVAYHTNAMTVAAKCKDMKSMAEFYDAMKALNHADLEAEFKRLSDEMDRSFDRDDKGNLVWDAAKAEAVCLELAKGFE